jgi:hypothetical protein
VTSAGRRPCRCCCCCWRHPAPGNSCRRNPRSYSRRRMLENREFFTDLGPIL